MKTAIFIVQLAIFTAAGMGCNSLSKKITKSSTSTWKLISVGAGLYILFAMMFFGIVAVLATLKGR